MYANPKSYEVNPFRLLYNLMGDANNMKYINLKLCFLRTREKTKPSHMKLQYISLRVKYNHCIYSAIAYLDIQNLYDMM